MSEKLLPCPFCGEEAEIKSFPVFTNLRPYSPETADKKYYVQCKGCATQCGALEYDTPEEAIAAWNRRAGGWIAVTEKLPEEGETFLGWHKDGFVIMTVNMFDEMDEVTHWMPLPQGPEGADRNG